MNLLVTLVNSRIDKNPSDTIEYTNLDIPANYVLLSKTVKTQPVVSQVYFSSMIGSGLSSMASMASLVKGSHPTPIKNFSD